MNEVDYKNVDEIEEVEFQSICAHKSWAKAR